MEMLIILGVGAAALFLMNNRVRKQQRAAASFRDTLTVGQEVMTGSGFFGTVTAVEDDVITLESTPGTETRWLRAAIAKLVEPPVDEVEEPAEGTAGTATDQPAAVTVDDADLRRLLDDSDKDK